MREEVLNDEIYQMQTNRNDRWETYWRSRCPLHPSIIERTCENGAPPADHRQVEGSPWRLEPCKDQKQRIWYRVVHVGSVRLLQRILRRDNTFSKTYLISHTICCCPLSTKNAKVLLPDSFSSNCIRSQDSWRIGSGCNWGDGRQEGTGPPRRSTGDVRHSSSLSIWWETVKRNQKIHLNTICQLVWMLQDFW